MDRIIIEGEPKATDKWLKVLAKEAIKNGKFPLNDILKNSLFYPSCGNDGGPVKYLSRYVNSFIYADYGLEKKEVKSNLNSFRGYQIIKERDVSQEELGK
ncbi:MAG: hypothetical protein WCH76_08295 [Candidatus Riflemargulisbacteria bacterium]